MRTHVLLTAFLCGGCCIALTLGPRRSDVDCSDGPAPVVWPLGDDGFQTRRLYDSHGQFLDIQKTVDSAYLHAGIDIAACPGEVVYAVQAGKVVYVGGSTEPGTDSRHLFIVDDDDPTSAWLYQHLEEIWVDDGEDDGDASEVERDQALGTVASYDAAPHFTHVHLQRCVLKNGGTNWLSHRKDGGDPLGWLASHADPEAPQILPVPASNPSAPHLRFFADNDPMLDLGTQELGTHELAGATVDVVARIRDLFPGEVSLDCSPSPCATASSVVDITPCRITLQILLTKEDPKFQGSPRAIGTVVYSNVIDLSAPMLRPADAAEDLYSTASFAEYAADREFHLILTHCLDGSDKPWTVGSDGALLLQLVLEDASGNVDVHEMPLDFAP